MYDQFGRFIPDSPGAFYQRPQFPGKMEIIHVNGRGGAEAYQMPANSNTLLLDDTQAIVWLKQTDGAGYPTLTPYTITPYKPEPQISSTDLLTRIERLEALINDKPDTQPAKHSKSAE